MNQFRPGKNIQPGQNPSTTWIFTNGQTQLDGFESLKGWQKTTIDHSNDPSLKFNSDDVIDLNNWKYHQEVPIVDHMNLTPPSEGESQTGSELKEKEEDGLTLLGGLDG